MKGENEKEPGTSYFMLPAAHPKYFFSANSYYLFKKGLAFYRPIGFKALLKKKTLLFSYPIFPLLRIRKVALDELIKKYNLGEIKRASEKFGIWGSLYKPPGDSKLIVQLLDREGNITAYMKIGLSQDGNSRINSEANALQFLKESGFSAFEFPEILERGKENQREFIVLHSPPRLLAPRKISIESVLPGLRELFNLQKRERKLREISHTKEILQRVEKSSYSEEISEKLHKIISEIGEITVPAGCLHFDFKPWNIFINKVTGKLFVIDWEFFRKEGLPLWDLFTFVILPLLLVKYYGKPPKKVTPALRKCVPLFEKEITSFGLNKDLIEALLTLYLADMGTFFDHYGHRDERTEEIVKKITELTSIRILF